MTLDELISCLSQDPAPDHLWAITTGFLASEGFDKVIRISTGPHGASVRTTMSTGFQDYYADKGYLLDDPFLDHCLTAPGPVATGEDYLADYGYLTDRGRALIQAAGEDGFRAGFSVGSPGHLMGRAIGWNVGSSLRRAEVEKIRKEKEPVIRLALLAVQDRLDGGTGTACLSPRERECLGLVADGLRIKAIAAELGIRPVTVELHLANARRKLGAANREQAVALAFGLRAPRRGG